jgi:hypothetical protein
MNIKYPDHLQLLEGLKEVSRENPAYFFNLLVKDSSLLDESLHDVQLSIPKDVPGLIPWRFLQKLGQYQGRRYGRGHSRVSYRSNESVYPDVDFVYTSDDDYTSYDDYEYVKR